MSIGTRLRKPDLSITMCKWKLRRLHQAGSRGHGRPDAYLHIGFMLEVQGSQSWRQVVPSWPWGLHSSLDKSCFVAIKVQLICSWLPFQHPVGTVTPLLCCNIFFPFNLFFFFFLTGATGVDLPFCGSFSIWGGVEESLLFALLPGFWFQITVIGGLGAAWGTWAITPWGIHCWKMGIHMFLLSTCLEQA